MNNGLITGLGSSLAILVAVVATLAVLLYLIPIPLWIAAWASGASHFKVFQPTSASLAPG